MPRATFKPDRLYVTEISVLQRLLKFTNVDERIPLKVRQHISANVAYLVTMLSNAQVNKPVKPNPLDNEV